MHFAQPRRQNPGLNRSASSSHVTNSTFRSLFLMTGLLACLILVAQAPAAAQKQNQKGKQQDSQSAEITSPIAPPDPQAIDLLVSRMLGAWQVGDVDMMHKAYADDVTVVSGQWEQPIFGWANYVHAYQAQRARTQGDRMDRTNTYTKVMGDTAWCTYQWRYTGEIDGVPAAAFGHTTLVLEKRGGAWLIVLNHTSVVPVSQPASSAAASQAPQTASQRSGIGNQ